MKHWILWRVSPRYRQRLLDEWDQRFFGFWEAAAMSQLSQTEVGRAALLGAEESGT